MKKRVGLFGATGRMGKEISQLLATSSDLELHYAVQRTTAWDESRASEVDVWIDFSLPEAFEAMLQRVKSTGKPLVSGTTGLSAEQLLKLKQLAENQPVLWASNMSLGVAVLSEALKALSALSDFDFQIEEIHHHRKKDKPSGTAITLQENLKRAVQKDLPEPVAIRGGGVFGEHKIYALGEEEVLTFSHSALNRTVFAKGAVRAASWIIHQKSGYYSIANMLFKN
ncbi:hypothetical protein BDW_00200 [Bdellovibrio bacteriovorus W]|nr:hypothetical protein BDW_00200 [Bdellovibrio bacteriovorus W]